jgi:hypothetical protein
MKYRTNQNLLRNVAPTIEQRYNAVRLTDAYRLYYQWKLPDLFRDDLAAALR